MFTWSKKKYQISEVSCLSQEILKDKKKIPKK